MNAFCQRQGVNLNAVRFLFDGTRINSDQTPEGLEMEDGDVIDVMVEQQGGGRLLLRYVSIKLRGVDLRGGAELFTRASGPRYGLVCRRNTRLTG